MDDDLRYLFHGYFDNMWPERTGERIGEVRGTWRDVVREFFDAEPDPRYATAILAELSIVLESPLAEGERLYDEWDPNYWPFSIQTMREWLIELRDQLAVELLANDKLGDDPVGGVMASLDSLGFRLPSSVDDQQSVEQAATFGALAELSEVFAFLSAVSIALAPSTAVDDPTRAWLETIRTAAAQSAVPRWDSTARHLEPPADSDS